MQDGVHRPYLMAFAGKTIGAYTCFVTNIQTMMVRILRKQSQLREAREKIAGKGYGPPQLPDHEADPALYARLPRSQLLLPASTVPRTIDMAVRAWMDRYHWAPVDAGGDLVA